MARSYTITQSGESRNYSIDDGVGAPGSDATVTTAAVRAAVPNIVEVASPANDDFIQRVSGSWVSRTIAQVRTALGLGSAAYTDSTDYATAAQGIDERVPTAAGISAKINAATSKTNPADNDEIGTADSAASFGFKKFSLINLWDNYFNEKAGAIYSPIGHTHIISNVTGLQDELDGKVDTDDSRLTDERVPTAAGLASKITTATSKATPVDADELALADSAASFGLKKLTFANLWAWVKAKIESVTISTVSISGNLTVDTNTLFVDAANNRVGIGTASPTATLHSLNTANLDY